MCETGHAEGLTSASADRLPLDKTFDTVDEKLAETEFFLRQMASVGTDEFAFKCFLSAYLAAARTATLALQRFSQIPGFPSWYRPHQARLKADPLAKFMFDARNDHLHGAPYPIAGASFHRSGARYYFSALKGTGEPPKEDILTVCREHLVNLLDIGLDCYASLGIHIDPQQHYTKEHFESTGRDIEHAECEVFGWVCESLAEEGLTEDDRWHELRGHVSECKINDLFYNYLGKTTPPPNEPEHFEDFAFTPDDQGWVAIPVGFKSREAYWEQYPDRRPPGEWWKAGRGKAEARAAIVCTKHQRQESSQLPLRALFDKWNDSRVGPMLIRLTVLYEDLRLEYRAALADDLGPVDVNAIRYRCFYFQRRIYASLHEIQGALHQLNCSGEFSRYRQEQSANHSQNWCAAIKFFEEHADLIKRRRNLFGAHFGNKAALQARENMTDAVSGQMSCLIDEERHLLDPSHLFAYELATLVFYGGVDTAGSRTFSRDAERFIQDAMSHAGNAFLAISAICFLPYFGWKVRLD